MIGVVERVLARHLQAKAPEIPTFNRKKDRVVYVLPDTLKEKSDTYEKIPEDKTDHVEHKGKPEMPAKPQKPRHPHKPTLPRGLGPAPIRPPIPPVPIKPVDPVKPVKPIPPVKTPEPPKKPRKWELKKPKPSDVLKAAHVVERYLAGVGCQNGPK